MNHIIFLLSVMVITSCKQSSEVSEEFDPLTRLCQFTSVEDYNRVQIVKAASPNQDENQIAYAIVSEDGDTTKLDASSGGCVKVPRDVTGFLRVENRSNDYFANYHPLPLSTQDNLVTLASRRPDQTIVDLSCPNDGLFSGPSFRSGLNLLSGAQIGFEFYIELQNLEEQTVVSRMLKAPLTLLSSEKTPFAFEDLSDGKYLLKVFARYPDRPNTSWEISEACPLEVVSKPPVLNLPETDGNILRMNQGTILDMTTDTTAKIFACLKPLDKPCSVDDFVERSLLKVDVPGRFRLEVFSQDRRLELSSPKLSRIIHVDGSDPSLDFRWHLPHNFFLPVLTSPDSFFRLDILAEDDISDSDELYQKLQCKVQIVKKRAIVFGDEVTCRSPSCEGLSLTDFQACDRELVFELDPFRWDKWNDSQLQVVVRTSDGLANTTEAVAPLEVIAENLGGTKVSSQSGSLVLGQNDELWIATVNDIYLLEAPHNGEPQRFFDNSMSSPRKLLTAGDGSLWFTFNRRPGIHTAVGSIKDGQLDLNPLVDPAFLDGNKIDVMRFDRSSRLWIGGENGLGVWNKESSSWTSYLFPESPIRDRYRRKPRALSFQNLEVCAYFAWGEVCLDQNLNWRETPYSDVSSVVFFDYHLSREGQLLRFGEDSQIDKLTEGRWQDAGIDSLQGFDLKRYESNPNSEWFAARQAIYQRVKASGQIRVFNDDTGFLGQVSDDPNFAMTGDGKLFYAVQSKGVFRIDHNPRNRLMALDSGEPRDLIATDAETIYYSMEQKGISKLSRDGQKKTLSKASGDLPFQNITALLVESDEVAAVASFNRDPSNGLLRTQFALKSDTGWQEIDFVSQKLSLRDTGDSFGIKSGVFSIVRDKNNRLWVLSGRAGFAVFDQGQWLFSQDYGIRLVRGDPIEDHLGGVWVPIVSESDPRNFYAYLDPQGRWSFIDGVKPDLPVTNPFMMGRDQKGRFLVAGTLENHPGAFRLCQSNESGYELAKSQIPGPEVIDFQFPQIKVKDDLRYIISSNGFVILDENDGSHRIVSYDDPIIVRTLDGLLIGPDEFIFSARMGSRPDQAGIFRLKF
ncbi:MAG: hypothetical protein HRU19_28810 [Pseudobacteriovorax sp.]|nr:hypothetical protein [Pseudobacteriovorax sp.]